MDRYPWVQRVAKIPIMAIITNNSIKLTPLEYKYFFIIFFAITRHYYTIKFINLNTLHKEASGRVNL